MSDLESVKQKIAAVEFLLRCFSKHPDNEVERNKLIREKAAVDEAVETYSRFTEEKLEKQLESLQDDLKSIRNEHLSLNKQLELQLEIQLQGE